MPKARDDALVVYAQNGEPLRPEQGFPIRLLLPGYEGNMNVKWLRRLKLGTEPFMTRWETSKYTDPLPGGKVRQFSFEMDAKSIITSPAYPQKLDRAGLVAGERARVERPRTHSARRHQHQRRQDVGRGRAALAAHAQGRTCAFSTCGNGTAMRV